MILAEKIIRLRKKLGWSQEELAEKMNVSRQSVSKWEGANSIPDLNKIIMLSQIFDVSTDFLLKDDHEEFVTVNEAKEPGINHISLEQATEYVEHKIAMAAIVTKGVVCCVCAAMPLFFFMAMAETNRFNMTGDIASVLGIVCVLIFVAIGVSFFIKTNQYQDEISAIEDAPFELAYGVHSVFHEKRRQFRSTYNLRLSVGIFCFIVSFFPLMCVSIFSFEQDIILLMVAVLLFMIAVGLFIILPVSAKYDAYSNVLKEAVKETETSRRAKRAEKLAEFYWPLLTAIYLGWSFWTMAWGTTWIVWPVGAVLFGALVGLMELLHKDTP